VNSTANADAAIVTAVDSGDESLIASNLLGIYTGGGGTEYPRGGMFLDQNGAAGHIFGVGSFERPGLDEILDDTSMVGVVIANADDTHPGWLTSATGAVMAHTIALTDDKLSTFAATTSAELAGVLSNETGAASGTPLAVFNQAPALTSPVITAKLASAADTTDLGDTTTRFRNVHLANGGLVCLNNGSTTAGTLSGSSPGGFDQTTLSGVFNLTLLSGLADVVLGPAGTTTKGVLVQDGSGTGTLKHAFYASGAHLQHGKTTTYNNIATAGIGLVPVYGETAPSATKTANFTALSYTPPATAGRYRVGATITTTSSTNTGTLQVTVDYMDSQGATVTAAVLPLVDAAAGIGTTRTSAATKEFYALPKTITVNNAQTTIVIKVVITGTVSYTVSPYIEQLG